MTKPTKFDPAMLNLMDKRDAALTYAEQGWPVYPCRPKGIEPHSAIALFGGKPTTDRRIIHRFFTKFPDANIGIQTGSDSGIWMVVFLNEGKKTLEKVLPEDYIARVNFKYTIVLYVTIPEGCKMVGKVKVAPGVTVYGDGEQVIAPPSRVEVPGFHEYVAFEGCKP